MLICPLANSIALSPQQIHTLPLRTPAVPNPALPAVTSRSAWLALEPVEIDRARIVERRRRHLSDAERGVADGRERRCWSAPPPPSGSIRRRGVGVEFDGSVIDERAGRRHRGPVFEIERRSGADEASPVSALFDPSAVLSSMKASFPIRPKRGRRQAGDLPARELDRAVAGQLNPPLRTPAVPNPALPAVTSRSAWLALEPVRWIEPVLSSDAAVTSSDAERRGLPMARKPLLVSAPATVRLDPPSPAW